MNRDFSKYFLLIFLLFGFGPVGWAQETDRAPFALEFPELSSGLLIKPKEFVTRSDLNVVRFWTLNPVAETIDWGKIKVKINRLSANIICAQVPGSMGKMMRCDLNRQAGFRLNPRENYFEIEAIGRDGKRFFASFIVATDPMMAKKDDGAKAPVSTSLGFSGRKFAVVMGVSKYIYNDAGLGNLEYADDDADSMNEWLTKKGGFTPDNILHLTNEKATLNGVRDSLGRFLTRATETDLVLFFFAGHGTPDPYNPKELYYLVADSKVTDLKRTGLPMTELKQIIDTQLRSKRAIFLLDTCHSAGLSGTKVVSLGKPVPGGRGISEQTMERQLQQVEVKNEVSQAASRLFGSAGRAVFTSSGAGEASRESPAWGGGHGVFTWALLEGLNGKADLNNNKVITAEELFSFVRERVQKETKMKQNPQIFSNLSTGLEIAVLK